jgi:hypothetical protein
VRIAFESELRPTSGETTTANEETSSDLIDNEIYEETQPALSDRKYRYKTLAREQGANIQIDCERRQRDDHFETRGRNPTTSYAKITNKTRDDDDTRYIPTNEMEG